FGGVHDEAGGLGAFCDAAESCGQLLGQGGGRGEGDAELEGAPHAGGGGEVSEDLLGVLQVVVVDAEARGGVGDAAIEDGDVVGGGAGPLVAAGCVVLVALAEQQHVGQDVGSGGALVRLVGQAHGADEVCALVHFAARCGVLR